jgi:hypothetical protein
MYFVPINKNKLKKHMTKHNKTKNGRKINTYVRNEKYSISFTRPIEGVKDERMHLNVTGVNPVTKKMNKVQLNGRAIAILRKLLAA